MAPKILYLNVRGTYFCANPTFVDDHKLSKLYDLIHKNPTFDKNEHVFIDVNPRIFELIMDYLKHTTLPSELQNDQELFLKFKKEVEYFKLNNNLEPLSNWFLHQYKAIKSRKPCEETKTKLEKLLYLVNNEEKDISKLIKTELTKYAKGNIIIIIKEKRRSYYSKNADYKSCNITIYDDVFKYNFIGTLAAKVEKLYENVEFLKFLNYIDNMKCMKAECFFKRTDDVFGFINRDDFRIININKLTTLCIGCRLNNLTGLFETTYDDDIIGHIKSFGSKCFKSFVEVEELDD